MKTHKSFGKHCRFYSAYPFTTTALLLLAGILYSQPSQSLPIENISDTSIEENVTQSREADVEQLYQEGIQQFRTSQFQEALKTYQQVLKLRQDIGDKIGEGETLYRIGVIYRYLGQYLQAKEYIELALEIAQTFNEPTLLGRTLSEMGVIYYNLGQYPKALEFYQQALAIGREIGDRTVEAHTLDHKGIVHRRQGEYSRALELHQQALAISREIGDRAVQGRILNNIGFVYNRLGDYSRSLEFDRQALAVSREIGDRFTESRILNTMGVSYWNLGQNLTALEFYEQALAMRQEIGDKAGEGRTLNNIGIIHYGQARYFKALEFYEESLATRREIGDRFGEGITLSNIGAVYWNLGQYAQALEFYQQSLTIRREIRDRRGEAYLLSSIGSVYSSQEQYDRALEFDRQALAIRQEIGDKAGQGHTLNGIGVGYYNLGQDVRALEVYEQALAIRQEIGDRAGEGITLNSMGLAYNRLGEYFQALESYQKALGIFREIGNRSGERNALGNIGFLLEQQNQIELAIIFYKQSVNVTEAIRQDLRSLSPEQQQSYTETVAETYRRLADLLLKEDRVLEAQQVLDLLKIQELDDYLGNVRGSDYRGLGIELLPQERQILADYNARQDEAIKLGRELAQLREIPPADRTPDQTQRIAELEAIQQQLRQEFNQFIRSPEIEALVQQLNQTARGQNLDLPNLNRLQGQLRQLEQNAVLLYPLILEERLELVLVTPYAPPIRHTVPVKREDLNQAIVEFRRAITNRIGSANRAIAPAQKLYDLLIKPIENDLAQANAQTLIYAADSQLRYIPLAALHDGEQWLIERFSINNITAASLINFDPSLSSQFRVLAAAFSEGSHEFQVGTERFAFAGLRFAGREVENIAAIIPSTTKLLNRAFNRDATIPQLNDHNIVHFATHAAFVPGQPDESFILFGDGDRATLRDVETWNLTDVDLVVLSACQTGIGGVLGNGEEILGLGYQMQQAGALATIASLWIVDDRGTQVLMDSFYEALSGGKMTTADALQQAQLDLVNSSQYDHPYYWAPFILIGNGL